MALGVDQRAARAHDAQFGVGLKECDLLLQLRRRPDVVDRRVHVAGGVTVIARVVVPRLDVDRLGVRVARGAARRRDGVVVERLEPRWEDGGDVVLARDGEREREEGEGREKPPEHRSEA